MLTILLTVGSLALAPLHAAQDSEASSPGTASYFKEKALEFAALNNAEQAQYYLQRYLQHTGDLSILNDHLFESIKSSSAYQDLKERYTPQLGPLSILYFIAGFFGIFISLLLLLRNREQGVAHYLMSAFVLFHSLFILHLSLYVANLQYSVPQALLVSTTFSFLYGPLLYFYFKRTVQHYHFRWRDVWHLLPSVGLFFYILPYYLLPESEKIAILFARNDYLMPGATWIIFGKILSLTVYGVLIYRLYEQNTSVTSQFPNQALWQRNIVAIYCTYVLAYIAYALVLIGWVSVNGLMHPQILVMVILVMYVSYVAYAQPEVFSGKASLPDPGNLFKYKKSRLTDSLSEELKKELLRLLEVEKIYTDNTLNLQKLAERLGTSRHSASQIINQHFQMNFYELINTYRIRAAMALLEQPEYRDRNIIEIAYEVGFNNKVSFNKSFKRVASATPTEFIASLES